jgi:hypothetical protein
MKKNFCFIVALGLVVSLVGLTSCSTGPGTKKKPEPKVIDYSLIIKNTCPYKIRVTVGSDSRTILANGVEYKVSSEAKNAKGVDLITGHDFDFFGNKKGEIILKLTDNSGGAAKISDFPLKLGFKSENVVDSKGKTIEYTFKHYITSNNITLGSDGHSYKVEFVQAAAPAAQAPEAKPAAAQPAAETKPAAASAVKK